MSVREEATVEAGPGERRSPRGIALAAVALAWMAGMLWSARVTITDRTDAAMAVTSTAYALPGAVSASLVAGAAGGLAVLAAVGRGRSLGATARFAIATGSGLLVGLLGAVLIVTINTDGWLYAVVGGTIAAAATIGGALAGFREPRMVAAACWAAVAVFVVGFALNVAQAPLLDLFGSGTTSASQSSAANWFSFTQSLLSGIAAGVVAYRTLRRSRAGRGHVRWPLYALAGAGPGLLLILAEGLARTAGARVLALAGRVSELELTVQHMLSGSRLNSALIVLFVGAITAIIAVGRTMKPAEDDA
jgi:hypothetical protein